MSSIPHTSLRSTETLVKIAIREQSPSSRYQESRAWTIKVLHSWLQDDNAGRVWARYVTTGTQTFWRQPQYLDACSFFLLHLGAGRQETRYYYWTTLPTLRWKSATISERIAIVQIARSVYATNFTRSTVYLYYQKLVLCFAFGISARLCLTKIFCCCSQDYSYHGQTRLNVIERLSTNLANAIHQYNIFRCAQI